MSHGGSWVLGPGYPRLSLGWHIIGYVFNKFSFWYSDLNFYFEQLVDFHFWSLFFFWSVFGGGPHSQIQTWEHFVRGGGVSQNVPNPKWKEGFIMTLKRPNNPPNLRDNNNIMKVNPLICSPESQNND